MQRLIKLMVVLTSIVIGAASAHAYSSYANQFKSTYPAAASTLGTCVLCHLDPAGGGPRNGFGTDFSNAGYSFSAIETLDSDGDGFTNLAEITAKTFPGDAASKPATPPPPATCTSFTYSAWGTCQSNGTQTRTVATSSPAGCTGGTPVTSQACTYVPPVPACTSYTYTVGACQSNGTAPVTGYTGIPAGCSGGAVPATTQPCTYVPPTCSSFTYSAWGACQSNNTQTRTVATSSPAGCTGGTPVTSQSCTYVPPITTCTSFTYSAWGACQSNNTQTRTVATSSPAGCTGGTPVTSQSCTYVPPVTTCSTFTYSAWGACQSNNTQTRTVATSSPAGCTGGTPVTSQSCTYVPPPPASCSYTYSAWGTCQSNNTQTRTVTSITPAGCTGNPVTSQSCTYVPPVTPPSTGTIPLPNGQMIYTYDAVASPVVSTDPSQAKPMGVGSVATGGNTLDVSVNVGPFAGTVNISLSEYAPSYGTRTVYSMDSEDAMKPSSGNIGAWKANVTGMNQHVFGPISVSKLKKGLYTLTLTVRPSGSSDDDEDGGNSGYYQWTTHFTIR